MNMEKGCTQNPGKFRVPDMSFPGFYLPSAQSVFKRFKLPHNLPLVLNAAEDYYGLDSKLSRSQKYKMVRGGINQKHSESFRGFVQAILGKSKLHDFEEGEMAKTFTTAYGLGSNAGTWLAMVQCFSQTKAFELSSPVIDFISSRAKTDLAFLENAKSNGVGKKGHVAKVEWMTDFVSNNTLVDNNVINKAVETHSKIISPADCSCFDKADYFNILRFNFSFEVDFYFSAIAIYDLALHSYIGEQKEANQSRFLDISAKYSKKNARNFFEGLLDELRYQNSEQENKPLSWYALEQYLKPHLGKSDPHTVMKKWKEGKELPSSYVFSLFMKGLSFPEDDVDTFIVDQYASIAIALDTLLSEWLSMGMKILNELNQLNIQVVEGELGDLIREVIGGLDKYYEAFNYHNGKKQPPVF